MYTPDTGPSCLHKHWISGWSSRFLHTSNTSWVGLLSRVTLVSSACAQLYVTLSERQLLALIVFFMSINVLHWSQSCFFTQSSKCQQLLAHRQFSTFGFFLTSFFEPLQDVKSRLSVRCTAWRSPRRRRPSSRLRSQRVTFTPPGN